MAAWEPVPVLIGTVLAGLALLHALGRWLRGGVAPLDTAPYSGGSAPREHAWSRFHVRWYPVTMIFLAFDMEMLFMYPWVKVVTDVGTGSVIEMFLFLAVLFAGVTYAWREKAFRWT